MRAELLREIGAAARRELAVLRGLDDETAGCNRIDEYMMHIIYV